MGTLRSDSLQEFVVKASGYTPFGRDDVRLMVLLSNNEMRQSYG